MTQDVAMYQVYSKVPAAMVDALKAVTGKDATNEEFAVFLLAAQKLGLDPFARQIQLIKFEGRPTHYTTIDGLRVIAGRSQYYAGQLGPQWCGPDGKWREVWLEEGPPAAARVGILRRDFTEPLYAVARFKSYNKGTGTWTRYPDVMIAKVAESLALRRAFPNETSGLYSDVELGRVPAENDLGMSETSIVDALAEHEPQPHPITALSPHQPRGKAAQADALYATGASMQKLRLRMRDIGLNTQAKADDFCELHLSKDWAALTEEDAPALEKWIAKREAERVPEDAGTPA